MRHSWSGVTTLTTPSSLRATGSWSGASMTCKSAASWTGRPTAFATQRPARQAHKPQRASSRDQRPRPNRWHGASSPFNAAPMITELQSVSRFPMGGCWARRGRSGVRLPANRACAQGPEGHRFAVTLRVSRALTIIAARLGLWHHRPRARGSRTCSTFTALRNWTGVSDRW